jgi:hypothetical protein
MIGEPGAGHPACGNGAVSGGSLPVGVLALDARVDGVAPVER